MTFHHLLEAFEGARICGLCALEGKAMRRYVDSILYESVTDPAVRADLRRAHGYCAAHGYYLLSLHAAFDTALLYQDEIEDMIELVESLDQQGGSRSKGGGGLRKNADNEEIPWEWLRHSHCPACRIQHETRKHYIEALVDGLRDEPMRRAFSSGSGVCMPHLRLLLEAVEEPADRRLMLNRQKESLLRLLGELRELCRKFDYRFSDEKIGEERDSWRRAVLLVNGSPLSFPEGFTGSYPYSDSPP